jgi:Flp pilus assembly protein TadG
VKDPIMLRRTSRPARRGVAAVEFGLVTMLFILPLLIGVWEVGRLVQVQQIVSNAAREGARLAAQGYTIKIDGTVTQIYRDSSGGTPNVRDAVYQYLYAAGLTNVQNTTSDLDVTFTFLAPRSDGATATDPYQGEKGQPFQVTVTIKDWTKVRWINLGLVNPTSVTFTVNWQMLIDDPFTVNTNLPIL